MDPFDRFLTIYSQGDLCAACTVLLNSPTTDYAALEQGGLREYLILNYVDALTQASSFEAWLCCGWLAMHMGHTNPELSKQLAMDGVLLKLANLLQIQAPQSHVQELMTQASKLLPDTLPYHFAIESMQSLPPEAMQALMQKGQQSPRMVSELQQLLYTQNCVDFAEKKASLTNCLTLERGALLGKPAIPLAYSLAESEQEAIYGKELEFADDEVPVFFMEQYDLDWLKMLNPFENRPALFLFPSTACFFQCLQFDAVKSTLLDKKHCLLVLDRYPGAQLVTQPFSARLTGKLTNVPLPGHPVYLEKMDSILEAVSDCLKLSRAEKKQDSPASDSLYCLGRKFLFERRAKTLGPDRLAAHIESTTHYGWTGSAHKGSAQLSRQWMRPYLNRMQTSRKSKAQPARHLGSTPYRVAHVVPQIVDGNHAPSTLLENILSHHDRSKFQTFLYSTESFCLRPEEYPINMYASGKSSQRAPERLDRISATVEQIAIDSAETSYSDATDQIVGYLKDQAIDVAIFHSVDVIHQAAVRLTDSPLKVQFDHGTLPLTPGPDLIITSSLDTEDDLKAASQELQCQVEPLSYVIDIRKTWLPHPYPKLDLGVPKDAKIMTTVSNHLAVRISSGMREALIKILLTVPNAYYLPMGPIEDREAFLQPFFEKGVGDRVKPLGLQSQPSQLARSMDVYLNEFPFGSGLAILESMAAGLPVVTMHDPDGPAQARFGAKYFGTDRSVPAGDVDAYVELACSLLQDQEKHNNWSLHATERYQEFTDIPKYVRTLETLIENALLAKTKS